MSRSSSWIRVIAGVLVVAVVVGVLALATVTIRTMRRGERARATHAATAARLVPRTEDSWVRRPAGGVEAPRAARLEAGRRVVELGGEVLGAEWTARKQDGAPYFVTTQRLPDDVAKPWADTVSAATDERLPEPSKDVRDWMDARGPALRAVAAEIAAGPTPEWEQDPRWDVTREARLADVLARHFEMVAAFHAQRGEHGDSEALLDAAWTLRAGIARLHPSDLGDAVLLGALRCTRVRDESEWLRRLESVDVRSEEAGDRLHLAARHLSEAEEAWIPDWVPAPARSLMRVPSELSAAAGAELAAEPASILQALDPCAEPVEAIPDTWERDRALARWPPTQARLRIAYDLIIVTEREIPLRLTSAVLRTRAGQPPGDRCDAIASSREPDGRVTLRWRAVPHPLAIDLGPWAPRAFTLDAPQ